jgi:hypothetical protein
MGEHPKLGVFAGGQTFLYQHGSQGAVTEQYFVVQG